MLDAACAAGAVVGNDISGFADPEYLPIAAKHDASVVATHIRLAPRVPDPEPVYDDLVARRPGLPASTGPQRAEAAGLHRDQIAVDAGLDLGKTPAMSAVLLRESDTLTELGYTVLLSASNKRFLGDTLGLDIGDRREVSLGIGRVRRRPRVPHRPGPRRRRVGRRSAASSKRSSSTAGSRP